MNFYIHPNLNNPLFKKNIFNSIFSLINCLEELVITLKLNVIINKMKNISNVTNDNMNLYLNDTI